MTRDGPAEVTFRSTVSARRMRFHDVSDIRVDFRGEPGHDSLSGSERTRLPKPVSTDVTYRDVRVDYRIVSRLRPRG